MYGKADPYGTAFDCKSGGSASGAANVDLRDTGFSIDPAVTFTPTGAAPGGTSIIDANRTSVAITGGGYCGWNGASSPFQLKQN